MANIQDAVYLIDDVSFYALQGGLNTAWDYCGFLPPDSSGG